MRHNIIVSFFAAVIILNAAAAIIDRYIINIVPEISNGDKRDVLKKYAESSKKGLLQDLIDVFGKPEIFFDQMQ